jgi:hypothetical protein
LPACGRNRTPNSLIDAAGYHVTGGTGGLYRPRAAILNGEWTFPTAVVAE